MIIGAELELTVTVPGNPMLRLKLAPALVINVKFLVVPSPYNSRVILPQPIGPLAEEFSGKF
jgi:hypothetical protein